MRCAGGTLAVSYLTKGHRPLSALLPKQVCSEKVFWLVQTIQAGTECPEPEAYWARMRALPRSSKSPQPNSLWLRTIPPPEVRETRPRHRGFQGQAQDFPNKMSTSPRRSREVFPIKQASYHERL